ncbi:MAG TPA: hypothetical protein VMT45_07020 [Thermoanaerobaculaceae bacterium]|nr:hypothetical protein [Thermoanaerobaculaceae bacterium]
MARATGSVTVAKVGAHFEEEQAARGLSYGELIDGRDAHAIFRSAEVREIAYLFRSQGKTENLGPTAVLVSSELGFGMMRMLGLLLDDVCAVRPFYRLKYGQDSGGHFVTQWGQSATWPSSPWNLSHGGGVPSPRHLQVNSESTSSEEARHRPLRIAGAPSPH